MEQGIKGMILALCVALVPWALGCWIQRIDNEAHPPYLSFPAKSSWTLLLGVRPWRGERIYLRSLWLHITGILCFVLGSFASWLFDRKTAAAIIAGTLIVGLVGGSLAWNVARLIVKARSAR